MVTNPAAAIQTMTIPASAQQDRSGTSFQRSRKSWGSSLAFPRPMPPRRLTFRRPTSSPALAGSQVQASSIISTSSTRFQTQAGRVASWPDKSPMTLQTSRRLRVTLIHFSSPGSGPMKSTIARWPPPVKPSSAITIICPTVPTCATPFPMPAATYQAASLTIGSAGAATSH